jgi:hypothetical protein
MVYTIASNWVYVILASEMIMTRYTKSRMLKIYRIMSFLVWVIRICTPFLQNILLFHCMLESNGLYYCMQLRICTVGIWDGSDEIYKKYEVENIPYYVLFSMSDTNMHAISSKHLVSSILARIEWSILSQAIEYM